MLHAKDPEKKMDHLTTGRTTRLSAFRARGRAARMAGARRDNTNKPKKNGGGNGGLNGQLAFHDRNERNGF